MRELDTAKKLLETEQYTVFQPLNDIYVLDEGAVRNFLFTGRDAALLVDTGFGNIDYRGLVASLTALPLLVANTHCHEDHVCGNGAFSQVYMHPGAIRAMGQSSFAPKVEAIPMEEGYVFDLGGHHIEVVACPGHTDHDVTFLDVENRLLAGGDVVMEFPMVLFPEASDPASLIRSAKHLRTLGERYDCILPSHGRWPLKRDVLDSLEAAAGAVLAGESGTPFTDTMPDGQALVGEQFRSGGVTLLMIDPKRSQLKE